METNYAKELDSHHQLMAELKRKRVGQFQTGATHMSLPPQSTLNTSLHKFRKRRKLDESKFHCGRCTSQPKRSLLKYYSNFKKSGLPQRLMCYRNGEWTDFPQEVVSLVKKDFQIKRAATEVELDGHLFVIDFLHMMKLDLKTGMQQPIAWIDEAGACFFPETFFDHDKIHECCYHEYEEDQGHLVPEPHGSNGSNDIKLKLEIDISGLDFSKSRESSGESNDIVSQIQVVQKPAMDAEADNSCIRVSNEEVCKAFGENQQEENLVLLDPFHGDLNSNTVQEMFLKGLSSFMKADIVEVSSGSGIAMQARWELFQKQVEITKRYRGDANVRYAWLPSSKEALSSVMTYGLGDCGITKSKSTYGIGVLLLPANCTQSRPKALDVLHHPLFWNSEMRLAFLRDTSDRVELEDREINSDFLKSLESVAPVAIGGKWDVKMEPAFISNIGHYRRYKFDSVRDLLRVMRNKLNHYRKLPKDIQELLGAVPEGFDDYFGSRFPKLLIQVYNVVYKYCKDDEWVRKYSNSNILLL